MNMKRKRPTRDDAAAKYRQAVDRRNAALGRLVHLTSTFFLALTQKEPNKAKPET